jgi:hypothetical protein
MSGKADPIASTSESENWRFRKMPRRSDGTSELNLSFPHDKRR